MLLDDEVIALSVRAGTPWPTATPTVSRDSEQAMAAATERGALSLVTRGYLTNGEPDGLDLSLASLIDLLLGGNQLFETFVGTESLVVDLRFAFSGYFESPEGWIREITTPNGVHYIGRSDPNDSLRSAADLIDQAVLGRFHASLGIDEDEAKSLWLGVVGEATGDAVKVALARPDELRVGVVAAATGEFESRQSVDHGDQAIGYVRGRSNP